MILKSFKLSVLLFLISDYFMYGLCFTLCFFFVKYKVVQLLFHMIFKTFNVILKLFYWHFSYFLTTYDVSFSFMIFCTWICSMFCDNTNIPLRIFSSFIFCMKRKKRKFYNSVNFLRYFIVIEAFALKK